MTQKKKRNTSIVCVIIKFISPHIHTHTTVSVYKTMLNLRKKKKLRKKMKRFIRLCKLLIIYLFLY
jgi:hypothetical protein